MTADGLEHHRHVAAAAAADAPSTCALLQLLGETLEDHLPALGVRDLAPTDMIVTLTLSLSEQESCSTCPLRVVACLAIFGLELTRRN